MFSDARFASSIFFGTGADVPSGMAVVQKWVERLAAVANSLAGGTSSAEPQAVAELVSLFWRIKRVGRDFVDELGAKALIKKAEGILGQVSESQLRAVMDAFSAEVWIRQLERLADLHEESNRVDAVAPLAQSLLEELDRVELIEVELAKRGIVEENWASSIGSCVTALLENPDLFWVVGTWVKGVCELIAEDVEDSDPELACTTIKFHEIVASIQAEAEAIARERAGSFTAEQLRMIYEAATRAGLPRGSTKPADGVGSSVEPSRPDWWLPPVSSPVVAAAASEVSPRYLPPLKWRSPLGDYEARLIMPERPLHGEEEAVHVTFYNSANKPAEMLTGAEVELAGCSGRIDSEGKAAFKLGELRAKGKPPELLVKGIAWTVLNP